MTDVENLFHHHLKSTGNKVTSQRDVVLKVFLKATGHLTAEEIYQRAKQLDTTLGYTTVYRTMKLLVECGIARSEKFDDGHTRYEVDYQREHHDHLICTGCGLVVEFFNPFIEAEQDNIAHRFGFQLTHHSMRIFGVCSSCQQARQLALEISLP